MILVEVKSKVNTDLVGVKIGELSVQELFELQKSEEVMILSLEKGFQCVSNYRKTTYPQRKTQDIFNAFSINFFLSINLSLKQTNQSYGLK